MTNVIKLSKVTKVDPKAEQGALTYEVSIAYSEPLQGMDNVTADDLWKETFPRHTVNLVFGRDGVTIFNTNLQQIRDELTRQINEVLEALPGRIERNRKASEERQRSEEQKRLARKQQLDQLLDEVNDNFL